MYITEHFYNIFPLRIFVHTVYNGTFLQTLHSGDIYTYTIIHTSIMEHFYISLLWGYLYIYNGKFLQSLPAQNIFIHI